MPLSALTTLQVQEPFWQGWTNFLHPLPQVSTQEGIIAAWLNQQKPPSFTHTFVPQSALPQGMAYESFIFETQQIPTRDGLHDFFNGLCWLNFPNTKRHFNHIHQDEINHLGTAQRGKVRDVLTVIDENGFLIQCPDELWEALEQKQWLRAFWELRPLWKESKVMVFGHALLEKLIHPYKAITAHALRIPSSVKLSSSEHDSSPHFNAQDLALLDNYLTGFLTQEVLAQKPYRPIQIFGIPNWSREEQTLSFYQDPQVFRMPNSLKHSSKHTMLR